METIETRRNLNVKGGFVSLVNFLCCIFLICVSLFIYGCELGCSVRGKILVDRDVFGSENDCGFGSHGLDG